MVLCWRKVDPSDSTSLTYTVTNVCMTRWPVRSSPRNLVWSPKTRSWPVVGVVQWYVTKHLTLGRHECLHRLASLWVSWGSEVSEWHRIIGVTKKGGIQGPRCVLWRTPVEVDYGWTNCNLYQYKVYFYMCSKLTWPMEFKRLVSKKRILYFQPLRKIL